MALYNFPRLYMLSGVRYLVELISV